MSETVREIERVKGEMDKLVELTLEQHLTLSDSRHYNRMLQLNEQLELLYRELAYNEPTLYRSIVLANIIRSDIINGMHVKDAIKNHYEGTA